MWKSIRNFRCVGAIKHTMMEWFNYWIIQNVIDFINFEFRYNGNVFISCVSTFCITEDIYHLKFVLSKARISQGNALIWDYTFIILMSKYSLFIEFKNHFKLRRILFSDEFMSYKILDVLQNMIMASQYKEF